LGFGLKKEPFFVFVTLAVFEPEDLTPDATHLETPGFDRLRRGKQRRSSPSVIPGNDPGSRLSAVAEKKARRSHTRSRTR
jgi:hypothetical protein